MHHILIRSTYSASGGVERVTVSMIEGLLQRGDRVTLLTLPGQAWPVTHPRLSIQEMGIARFHRLLQAWSFNRAVIQYLKHHDADCVLSLDKVSTFSHLHAGGGTHKSFLRIKNENANALERWFRRFSLFHRYILRLERQGFENPMLERVRCNSQLVREDIIKDYGVAEAKLLLIHSGIRWKEMAQTYAQRQSVAQELCARHQLDPRWKMLLFLGSGFSRKGLEVAIQGLSSLPPDYHLIVVGKGNAKRYQRTAAGLGLSGRVHFLGAHPQGWRYAAMCRALVLPSFYDPFGGASAEGHAMGLPVLVSDKTGYADRVIHGVNGVILPTPMTPERVGAAFNTLGKIIESPQWTPNRIRRHARQVDDDHIMAQLLEHFIRVSPGDG